MASVLRAAFGKVNITPEETAPLQGYDPELYVADPETGILDDLYARIAMLDDGRCRTVIVSVDCGLTNEDFVAVPDPGERKWIYRGFVNTFPPGTRRSWAEAAGTGEACISVHATHTHSAPAHFPKKYTARIQAEIAELAKRLVPVTVSIGTGSSGLAVARRPYLKANEDIPIDKSLHVVLFRTMQGEALGSFVNYAVHPTVLWNPPNRVSAEMVGLAMEKLEREQGNGFISLFIQGFQGDVGPRVCGPTSGSGEDTYPLVQQNAQQLYTDIAAAMQHLREIREVPLAAKQATVALPARETYHRPEIDVTLMGIRIGDIALLAVSGEIFNGYVGQLRPASQFPYTLFSACANGYAGYLPTYEAFYDGLGGYEMSTTPFTDQACDRFVSACAEVLQQLRQ
ncbi:hypothetical protein [Paenibacillus sp. GCM10027626]|uniref:hypothetical protein n=1 Tax=Paenibacillus sp. GCM10027626 TaxID=3273411 RepID=UPI00362B6EFB